MVIESWDSHRDRVKEFLGELGFEEVDVAKLVEGGERASDLVFKPMGA